MNARATFFVLGFNAERFPKLIEKIKSEGHEIGIHGYDHTSRLNQTPVEFEMQLVKTIRILKNICKVKIECYRAPQFSIVIKTSWAINILKKAHIKYDSSIFPVKTPLYGIPNAPRFFYHISSRNIIVEDRNEDFLEFPISTYRISALKTNIPIGGGFYLRLFPYSFIKCAIKKINIEKQPAIFYFHPWEIDPEQLKIKSYNSSYKWWRYYNLKNSEGKFKELLKDFKFTSIKGFLNKKL